MDPDRLLRFHRACVRARDALVLRARAPLGERGARRGLSRALSGFASAADALVAVVLAPTCAGCSLPLEHPTTGPVCDVCWNSILPLSPTLCDIPGALVSRACAAGEYDAVLRAIVHALKYDGRRSIAATLGAMMRDRGQSVLAGADAVVPVPLHPSRRRSRGFNQATDLAQHLGLPVCHALRRTRATATQADLPAARRHDNVREAFAPTPAAEGLTGKTVVLVDDVCTTGATLESCARALGQAGAADVRALTAARVVANQAAVEAMEETAR